MDTTPIKVTFRLRTPMVVPSTQKSLDSLLSWARVNMAEYHGHDNPWINQHDIGVGVHQVGEDWCHMASNLIYTWASEHDQIHYTKKQSIGEYADAWQALVLKKRPSFDGTSGLTRAGTYMHPIRWVERIEAFAMVADMDHFRQLLPWITHIGKLHHKDYGAVCGFDMVESPEAQMHWANRILPVGSSEAKDHADGVGCLRSPYWKRENFQRVLIPV